MVLYRKNLSYKNSKLKESISNICNYQYEYFLNKANVVGIGFGYKFKNGFYTCQLCIQVFVIKKVPKVKLSCKDIIPVMFKGIPTDVVETGEITTCSLTERKRPVQGGYGISVANYNNYGTAGCLVTNGVSNFLLSTNHTLTGEGEFDIGTPIIQPAYSFEGRAPNDTIATLNKSIPIRPIEGERQPMNLTDCALGLLTKRSILSPEVALIGKLKGVKRPKLNDHVKKVGATTELTTGVVSAIHGTITVRFQSSKRYLFQDLTVTNFMFGVGDSGAILVNRYNYGVGLGIGGSQNIGIYCSLDTVLDQLDVHLVT